MARYSYECPRHGEFDVEAPMSETARAVACPLESCSRVAPKVLGASFQFTYGKDNFHGATIKERQERQYALAAEDGRGIEPVGERWV